MGGGLQMGVRLRGVFSHQLGFVGIRERDVGLDGTRQDRIYLSGFGKHLGVLIGTRISPPLDLSPAKRAGASIISWTVDTPIGTYLDVHVSLDDGLTWKPASNGCSIPGLGVGDDVVGKFLLVKQTFKTVNPETSPVLCDLSVKLDTYWFTL